MFEAHVSSPTVRLQVLERAISALDGFVVARQEERSCIHVRVAHGRHLSWWWEPRFEGEGSVTCVSDRGGEGAVPVNLIVSV